jgi:uncharacterized protein YecE (DUF72 family)
LREAGKLGAFLRQLSPLLSTQKHKLDQLAQLAALFDDQLAISCGIGIGLRIQTGMKLWPSFGLGSCRWFSSDAPESEHFTVMQSENIVTNARLTYLRLHGRNERGYIAGRDRSRAL